MLAIGHVHDVLEKFVHKQMGPWADGVDERFVYGAAIATAFECVLAVFPNKQLRRRLIVSEGCFGLWMLGVWNFRLLLLISGIAGLFEFLFHWQNRLRPVEHRALALVWVLLPHMVSACYGDARLMDVAGGVVLVDVGGYVGGKVLSPVFPWRPWVIRDVSPNKTSIGYFVGAFAGYLFWEYVSMPHPVLLVFAAIAGDLVASFIKRRWGVAEGLKDFGWMMGAHGGVLDRIDGHIAAFLCYSVSIMLS